MSPLDLTKKQTRQSETNRRNDTPVDLAKNQLDEEGKNTDYSSYDS